MRYSRPDWRRRRVDNRRRWFRQQQPDSEMTMPPSVPSEVAGTQEVETAPGLRNFLISFLKPKPQPKDERVLTAEDIRKRRREELRKEKPRKKRRKRVEAKPPKKERRKEAERAEAFRRVHGRPSAEVVMVDGNVVVPKPDPDVTHWYGPGGYEEWR